METPLMLRSSDSCVSKHEGSKLYSTTLIAGTSVKGRMPNSG